MQGQSLEHPASLLKGHATQARGSDVAGKRVHRLDVNAVRGGDGVGLSGDGVNKGLSFARPFNPSALNEVLQFFHVAVEPL